MGDEIGKHMVGDGLHKDSKGHQRGMSRVIYPLLRDVYITVTQRGTTIKVVFPEKRVCVFDACMNDKNRR